MKRPDKWVNLPSAIIKHIADNLNEIEYDPYESSRAEAIDQILYGYYYKGMEWHRNYQYMQDAYNALSDEELTLLVCSIVKDLRDTANNLEQWLNNP